MSLRISNRRELGQSSVMVNPMCFGKATYKKNTCARRDQDYISHVGEFIVDFAHSPIWRMEKKVAQLLNKRQIVIIEISREQQLQSRSPPTSGISHNDSGQEASRSTKRANSNFLSSDRTGECNDNTPLNKRAVAVNNFSVRIA